MVLSHVRRIQLAQYLDLLLDVLNLIFGRLQIDDFDGDDLLRVFLVPIKRQGESPPISEPERLSWLGTYPL